MGVKATHRGHSPTYTLWGTEGNPAGARTPRTTAADPTPRSDRRATRDTENGRRTEEMERRPQEERRRPQEDANTRAPWEAGPHGKKDGGRPWRYDRQKNPKPGRRTKDHDRERQKDENGGGPEEKETVEGSGGQAKHAGRTAAIWIKTVKAGRALTQDNDRTTDSESAQRG